MNRVRSGCFVYAINLGETVKVGRSDDPIARLSTFRTVAPFAKFISVFWYPNRRTAGVVERYFQALLSSHCVCGEVFRNIDPAHFWGTSQATALASASAFLKDKARNEIITRALKGFR